jgi:hypothetical protein
MAAARRSPQELLAQIDAKHDELLVRLDDLNERILAALAELVPVAKTAEPRSGEMA